MINCYKNDLVKYRISRAKEAIEEVEVLKKSKKYNAAVIFIS
ncbi:MAG: hypothetical protein ACYCXQ_09655 [Candidatus Humimicrobiaceae bacterium]